MNMKNRTQKLSGKPPQRHLMIPILQPFVSLAFVCEISGSRVQWKTLQLYNFKDALSSLWQLVFLLWFLKRSLFSTVLKGFPSHSSVTLYWSHNQEVLVNVKCLGSFQMSVKSEGRGEKSQKQLQSLDTSAADRFTPHNWERWTAVIQMSFDFILGSTVPLFEQIRKDWKQSLSVAFIQ